MAVINCCNFESCKDLVTIAYLKEVVERASGCTEVRSGSSFSSCCEADALAYTPTFGEISGGTYANVRSYNDSDPSTDVDGFSAITSGDYDGCCGTVGASGKCVSKDELYYGTTELDSIKFSIVTSAASCSNFIDKSTEFKVEEKDTYIRRTYTCSDNSVVQSESVSVSTFMYPTGRLTKEYGETNINIDRGSSIISGIATSTVSFEKETFSTSKSKKACGGEIVNSNVIEVSCDGYDDSVIVLCPRTIECDGGKISATTSTSCPSDIILSGATLDGATINPKEVKDGYTIYEVGKNNNNVTQSTFKLNFIIGNKEVESIDVVFNRESCTIGPSRVNPTPCGAFPVEDDWCSQHVDDIIIHDANGSKVTC